MKRKEGGGEKVGEHPRSAGTRMEAAANMQRGCGGSTGQAKARVEKEEKARRQPSLFGRPVCGSEASEKGSGDKGGKYEGDKRVGRWGAGAGGGGDRVERVREGRAKGQADRRAADMPKDYPTSASADSLGPSLARAWMVGRCALRCDRKGKVE